MDLNKKIGSFDVAVIGAGVIGSSAAYNLTKLAKKKKIVLVEQFDAHHTRGSSHGGSRITRKAYNKPYYAAMMEECFPMWETLEKESGEDIYHQTGNLYFAPEDEKELKDILSTLRKLKVPHKSLSVQEVNAEYPCFNIPEGHSCVVEPQAGILRASVAVKAFQKVFQLNGGLLLDHHKVLRIDPGFDTILVFTSKGVIVTKQLIIAAGAWTSSLLSPLNLDLPLKVLNPTFLYWHTKDRSLYYNMPCFVKMPSYNAHKEKHRTFYCGTPPLEYPGLVKPFRIDVLYWKANFGSLSRFAFGAYGTGKDHIFYGSSPLEYPNLVKICAHDGVEVNPDRRDLQGAQAHSTSRVKWFIDKYFKGVDSVAPAIVEHCMYTLTPDEDFIIDKHPLYQNIAIGAGFSGHGFKLAPVVGKLLGQLALDLPTEFNMNPFKVTRFPTKVFSKM